MNKLIFLTAIIPVLMLTVPNVYASGISTSDFAEHPERYCINYEDDPRCQEVDICDDEGEITSEHLFCTGGAVRYESSKGCPDGYHNEEGNDLGLCYDNDLGCQLVDELILNEDKTTCVEYKVDCEYNQDHPLCNGEERTDGIKVCNQPDHPGYKFCNGEN